MLQTSEKKNRHELKIKLSFLSQGEDNSSISAIQRRLSAFQTKKGSRKTEFSYRHTACKHLNLLKLPRWPTHKVFYSGTFYATLESFFFFYPQVFYLLKSYKNLTRICVLHQKKGAQPKLSSLSVLPIINITINTI